MKYSAIILFIYFTFMVTVASVAISYYWTNSIDCEKNEKETFSS